VLRLHTGLRSDDNADAANAVTTTKKNLPALEIMSFPLDHCGSFGSNVGGLNTLTSNCRQRPATQSRKTIRSLEDSFKHLLKQYFGVELILLTSH
jgi:hypothetical protein